MSARASKNKPGAAGLDLPDLCDLPAAALRHPDDERALAMVEKVPGIAWAMRKLGQHSYDQVLRASLLAKCVRAGDGAYPALAEQAAAVSRSLDVPAPEIFVRAGGDLRVDVLGSERPMLLLPAALLPLLEEDEMVALLAHHAGHVRCGHLPYLTVCDFVERLASGLGMACVPLAAPRMALEQWRRRAELSCDRAAALVCRDPEPVRRLLLKLAHTVSTHGGVKAAALAEQAREFFRITSGINASRLYRACMYLDAGSTFMVLRLAELERWVEGGEFQALRRGDYTAASRRDGDESREPPLWGEFAGSGVCPVCGQVPAGAQNLCSFCGWGGDLTSGVVAAAGGAMDAARQGAGVLARAAGAFFGALREQRPGQARAGDDGKERETAQRVVIPVKPG